MAMVDVQDLMGASGVRFGTSGMRGLVSGMTDEVCFAYTLAFLQAVSDVPVSRVALAMNLRPSSPAITSACAAAIRHAGMQVDFCGAIPTPALALYAQQQKMPGIMVTGSHIPFDRNGIKFYGFAGEITKKDELSIGGARVRLPQEGFSVALPKNNPAARQMYIGRYLDYFPPGCLSGLRLGFYEHSSVARDLLRQILEARGAEVISFGRTNEFVPVDTEAVSETDAQQARRWAHKYKLDAILSTDGDADRPMIGDEDGLWMRGDIVGLLCALYLGVQSVATPISCNTAVERCGAFPTVVRTRIGSPYVIEAMEQMLESGLQKVAGFEANGGFLLGSGLEYKGRVLAPLKTRDAILPILSLLAMAKENGCKLSRLPQHLPARYTASARLQAVPQESSAQILLRLAGSSIAIDELLGSLGGAAKDLDQTDGLRISMDNGEIVHFRPSGNAPELRCYAEADTPSRAELLARESLNLIRDRYCRTVGMTDNNLEKVL
jgi:phosphomannomutase